MSAGEMTLTTYVRYLYPGLMFSEESAHEVSERAPERIAQEAPSTVFAFTFYDVASTTAVIGGETVTLTSPAIRTTPRYYIDAESFTREQVAALPGDNSILLANMRNDGWDPMVRCRTGNWQPLGDGFLFSTGGAA